MKSLEYRRLELDLIMCYKVVRGFSDIAFETMFTFMSKRSRRGGHRYQLARRSCTANVVLHSFSFRVVRVWNKLPADVVEAKMYRYSKIVLKVLELHDISDLRY